MPPHGNSGRDTRFSQLLGLYAVQKLQHHFDSQERTKAAIISTIVADSTDDDIVSFARRFHSTTKHHLHLFACSTSDLSQLPNDPLRVPLLAASERLASRREWFYLLDLRYTVYLSDPLAVEHLVLPWPIFVRASRGIVELRSTIMERDLASGFDSNRVVKVVKDEDETSLRARLLNGFGPITLSPLDLNKGVKYLWEHDKFDSPSVRWKKSNATAGQKMDKQYSVRHDDPQLYNDLIDKPLFMTLFRWVGGGEVSIDHFSVDATEGTMTFGTFSDLDTGADYVVREILEHN